MDLIVQASSISVSSVSSVSAGVGSSAISAVSSVAKGVIVLWLRGGFGAGDSESYGEEGDDQDKLEEDHDFSKHS